MKDLDIKILIISRSRYDSILGNTCALLPEFIEVLVPVSEKEKYEAAIPNPILTVPDEVEGLGQLRNWILDNFEEETVIMIDDDINKCYCLTGYRTRSIKDPEEVLQIIINAAVMCKDAGLHCFGFSQTDIRKYNGTEPFKLNGWVGCVIGVIGRRYRFRNDKFKVDFDFCLQNILVDRCVWIDGRYTFAQKRDTNLGGNAKFRTEDEYNASLESLLEKWGDALSFRKHKGQVRLAVKVQRRQKIDYE